MKKLLFTSVLMIGAISFVAAQTGKGQRSAVKPLSAPAKTVTKVQAKPQAQSTPSASASRTPAAGKGVDQTLSLPAARAKAQN